ncbi:hypothetical protein C0Z11_02290 [Acidipropionibacterium jensenii]|nr:hypothetical protein C0Z11_02290 [Acidipropionibacterium jensenii]
MVWRPDPDFFDVITRVPPEVLEALGPVAGAAWAIRLAAPVFARKGVVIRPSAAAAAVAGFPLLGLSSRPGPAPSGVWSRSPVIDRAAKAFSPLVELALRVFGDYDLGLWEDPLLEVAITTKGLRVGDQTRPTRWPGDPAGMAPVDLTEFLWEAVIGYLIDRRPEVREAVGRVDHLVRGTGFEAVWDSPVARPFWHAHLFAHQKGLRAQVHSVACPTGRTFSATVIGTDGGALTSEPEPTGMTFSDFTVLTCSPDRGWALFDRHSVQIARDINGERPRYLTFPLDATGSQARYPLPPDPVAQGSRRLAEYRDVRKLVRRAAWNPVKGAPPFDTDAGAEMADSWEGDEDLSLADVLEVEPGTETDAWRERNTELLIPAGILVLRSGGVLSLAEVEAVRSGLERELRIGEGWPSSAGDLLDGLARLEHAMKDSPEK